MGFLKKAVGGIAKGINKTIGTNISVGGVGRISKEEQIEVLTNTIQQGVGLANSNIKFETDKTSNPYGGIKNAGNIIIDKLIDAGTNAIVQVVDNKAGQLVDDFTKTNSGQNLQTAMGNVGANVAHNTIKSYITKYWYVLLIALSVPLLLFSPKKTRKSFVKKRK